MNKSTIYKNSKDEWYTPLSVINYVKSLVGTITLDPATTKEQAQKMGIKNYYTKETNGLDKDWQGHRVWLNPPFSEKDKWIKKAYEEVEKGDCQIFLLLPASLETKAFHKYLYKNTYIHIPNKRIHFLNGDNKQNSAPFPSIIFEMQYGIENLFETFKLEDYKNE